jgi:hypothetical protein
VKTSNLTTSYVIYFSSLRFIDGLPLFLDVLLVEEPRACPHASFSKLLVFPLYSNLKYLG